MVGGGLEVGVSRVIIGLRCSTGYAYTTGRSVSVAAHRVLRGIPVLVKQGVVVGQRETRPVRFSRTEDGL